MTAFLDHEERLQTDFLASSEALQKELIDMGYSGLILAAIDNDLRTTQACPPFCRKAMNANAMSTRGSVPQRDQSTERLTNHSLTKQQPDAQNNQQQQYSKNLNTQPKNVQVYNINTTSSENQSKTDINRPHQTRLHNRLQIMPLSAESGCNRRRSAETAAANQPDEFRSVLWWMLPSGRSAFKRGWDYRRRHGTVRAVPC